MGGGRRDVTGTGGGIDFGMAGGVTVNVEMLSAVKVGTAELGFLNPNFFIGGICNALGMRKISFFGAACLLSTGETGDKGGCNCEEVPTGETGIA